MLLICTVIFIFLLFFLFFQVPCSSGNGSPQLFASLSNLPPLTYPPSDCSAIYLQKLIKNVIRFSLRSSCLEYVMRVSNSPSLFSSLCTPEFYFYLFCPYFISSLSISSVHDAPFSFINPFSQFLLISNKTSNYQYYSMIY